MGWAICKNCGKEKEIHSKGFCITCYKKLLWKPKKKICKRCSREIILHAKNLCAGCYQFVFHLGKNKAWNQKKNYNLGFELYKKITKNCVICGFDKVVELHHLDENKKNNLESNLIGLCPNHHKMIHIFEFKKEIRDLLIEKGFNLPEDRKMNFDLENTKNQ